FVAEQPGKAASAYLGLREASGDLLVIFDLEKGYAHEDVGRVIEPLARGEADVVVASICRESEVAARSLSPGSRPRPLRRIVDALSRPLTGITDPSSGLV